MLQSHQLLAEYEAVIPEAYREKLKGGSLRCSKTWTGSEHVICEGSKVLYHVDALL